MGTLLQEASALVTSEQPTHGTMARLCVARNPHHKFIQRTATPTPHLYNQCVTILQDVVQHELRVHRLEKTAASSFMSDECGSWNCFRLS